MSLKSSNKENSTTRTIIRDMLVFSANAWPHDSNSLADFGSEETGRLVTWFKPVLKKRQVQYRIFAKARSGYLIRCW